MYNVYIYNINYFLINYNRLIGDVNSSVTKKLNIANPYGPTLSVKKIECKNHILRNYMNRLKEMTTKRKSTIGVIVPGFLRKLLKNNKLRIR